MADAPLWVARAALVAVGLGLWFWTQRLIGARPFPSRGIGDAVHDWTEPWNRWLNAHPRGANALLIASSAVLVLLGVAIVLFEAGAVLVLRAHYTADVFAAIVTALWAAGVAQWAGPMVDRALAALVTVL